MFDAGNAGHECLILTFQEIVAPLIRRFNPDIILVSAGYDAHAKDPFELLQFSSKTYYFMAKELKAISDDICHGRLLFLLEGKKNEQQLVLILVPLHFEMIRCQCIVNSLRI